MFKNDIVGKVLNPFLKTARKALQSNTAKAIGHAIKEQAIACIAQLVADIIITNNIKEGLNREKIA